MQHSGQIRDSLRGLGTLEDGSRSSHSESVDKFAYVCLVMNGDFFVPGAVVMASSLRRTNPTADLVCMVTSDVSPAARTMLGNLYDKVVLVEYINAPARPMPTRHENNIYHYMQTFILTKFRSLFLEGYTKVCNVDADILVFRNMDSVFRLNAPAACFYNFWVHGALDPYPHNMQTGDIVPRASILKGLYGNHSFVHTNHVTLLPVGAEISSKFLDFVQKQVQEKGVVGVENCHSMTDEQVIAEFFTVHMHREWTHLGLQYCCVPWKHPSEEVANPYLYHYTLKRKPWEMERGLYPDLKYWWDEADKVSSTYPAFARFIPETTRHNLRGSLIWSDDLNSRLCLWCNQADHVFRDTECGAILCKHFGSSLQGVGKSFALLKLKCQDNNYKSRTKAFES